MINDDETEFLLRGSRKQLAKINNINTACSITLGKYDIDPGLFARNHWLLVRIHFKILILAFKAF